MDDEVPYEIEWPLLHMMVTRTISLSDAQKVVGVSAPTARTMLHHLESIGLVWQQPLDGRHDHSPTSRDWDITPVGRQVASRAVPEDRTAYEPPSSRVISGYLSRIRAA